MEFRLNTTVSAYPKIGPSILTDYVKRDELEKGYVKEAPDDGGVYGRQDKQWVELEPGSVKHIHLYYGDSSKLTFTSSADISALKGSQLVARTSAEEPQTAIIKDYVLDKVAYFWVCCSAKVQSILCFKDSLTVGCVYTNSASLDPPIKGEDGLDYHCYRLESSLIKNHPWNFKIIVE